MKREMSLEIDGKKVTVLFDESLGYWSIMGTFEGLLSEFIERPDVETEEHDG